jgi:translation initiation factor 1
VSPAGRRLVYSTGTGSVCPGCGHPSAHCRCARREDEPVPAQVTAKLRLETKARGGKSVTVVDGLPRNAAYVKALCRELKRTLGTGGAEREGAIELQGDVRERLRQLLAERGLRVRG